MTTAKPTLPRTLSKEDFEAIADHCYDRARKIIAKGRQVPSLVLFGTIRDGKLEVSQGVVAPISEPVHELMLTELMETYVQFPEINFVVHIAESWLLMHPEAMPTESIANHPRRTEAVTFNIMSKDSQIAVINPLHRKPNRLERGAVEFSVEMRGLMVREAPPKN